MRSRAELASIRYCRCGTRLAQDNSRALCAACQNKARDLTLGPPEVPDGFWDNDRLRDALADWHFGRVIAAYRHHPFHGHPIRQEIAARWMGVAQPQLSRIENGPSVQALDKLIYWARVFQVPPQLLWFKLPERRDISLYHSGDGRVTPTLSADKGECLERKTATRDEPDPARVRVRRGHRLGHGRRRLSAGGSRRLPSRAGLGRR